MPKSYQGTSSDEKQNRPSIESLTVADLLKELREGRLLGGDTFGLLLERDSCVKAGLPFPVAIFVTFNPELFKYAGSEDPSADQD
jgi:hypothetical protein